MQACPRLLSLRFEPQCPQLLCDVKDLSAFRRHLKLEGLILPWNVLDRVVQLRSELCEEGRNTDSWVFSDPQWLGHKVTHQTCTFGSILSLSNGLNLVWVYLFKGNELQLLKRATRSIQSWESPQFGEWGCRPPWVSCPCSTEILGSNVPAVIVVNGSVTSHFVALTYDSSTSWADECVLLCLRLASDWWNSPVIGWFERHQDSHHRAKREFQSRRSFFFPLPIRLKDENDTLGSPLMYLNTQVWPNEWFTHPFIHRAKGRIMRTGPSIMAANWFVGHMRTEEIWNQRSGIYHAFELFSTVERGTEIETERFSTTDSAQWRRSSLLPSSGQMKEMFFFSCFYNCVKSVKKSFEHSFKCAFLAFVKNACNIYTPLVTIHTCTI